MNDDNERTDRHEPGTGTQTSTFGSRVGDVVATVAREDRAARRRQLMRIVRIASYVFGLLMFALALPLCSLNATNVTLRTDYVWVVMFDAELDCGARVGAQVHADCAERDARAIDLWRGLHQPSPLVKAGRWLATSLGFSGENYQAASPADVQIIDGMVRGDLVLRSRAELPSLSSVTDSDDRLALMGRGTAPDRLRLLSADGGEAFFKGALKDPASRLQAIELLTETFTRADERLRSAAFTALSESKRPGLKVAISELQLLKNLEPDLQEAARHSPPGHLVSSIWRARAGESAADVFLATPIEPDHTMASLSRLLKSVAAAASSTEIARLRELHALSTTDPNMRLFLDVVMLGHNSELGDEACRRTLHQLLNNPAWDNTRLTSLGPIADCPIPEDIDARARGIKKIGGRFALPLAMLYGENALSLTMLDDHGLLQQALIQMQRLSGRLNISGGDDLDEDQKQVIANVLAARF